VGFFNHFFKYYGSAQNTKPQYFGLTSSVEGYVGCIYFRCRFKYDARRAYLTLIMKFFSNILSFFSNAVYFACPYMFIMHNFGREARTHSCIQLYRYYQTCMLPCPVGSLCFCGLCHSRGKIIREAMKHFKDLLAM
jgi:hypothetical protein